MFRRNVPSSCLIALVLISAAGSAVRGEDRAADAEPQRPHGRLRVIDREPSLLAMLNPPETNGAKDDRPGAAAAFEPFKDRLNVRWDQRWLYVESDGMPAHDTMVGITAWQQQVPLPKDYTGRNAWQIPLHPVPAKNPISIKGRFLRGAIALAVNGVPIFNPQNNRGEVSQEIGELDQYGGHCGRGDDYHYHAAPMFLEKVVGAGKPIAFALDGYPIYGSKGPDALRVDEKTLDAFHGKTDARGDYAYYASAKYPYVNGGFHGEVVERGGQVDPQPSAPGVRPPGQPLRGARITASTRSKNGKSYTLKYEVAGDTRSVSYTIEAGGSVKFDFVNGQGEARSETYSLGAERGDRGAPPGPADGVDGSGATDTRPGRAPFRLIPRAAEERLDLSPDQRKRVEQLERDAGAKLEAILTADQWRTLRDARPIGEGRPAKDDRRGAGPPAAAPAAGMAATDRNGAFVLHSPAVADGGALPAEFTGDGPGSTPPLAWGGAPEGTVAYALVMHHVDPEGKVKWYWVLYDIPGDVRGVPKDIKGIGKVGNNSVNGNAGYAPPHSKGPGVKSYVLTLYALSAPAAVTVRPSEVSRDMLLAAIKGRALASADLRVTYERPAGSTGSNRPPRAPE